MFDFVYDDLPNIQYTPNISSENVLFCYRDNDADSVEIAEYYQLARNIPTDNFLALDCSTGTTVTESDYISQIEDPLLAKIATLDAIYVIILGYHVPYMYTDEGDEYGTILSILSRLHRLGHTKSLQFKNPSFNRTASYRYFDEEDATELYITAVINGPDVDTVKAMIDHAVLISKNALVSGQLYCNPYGLLNDDYQTLVEEFVSLEIPNLGIESTTTLLPSESEYEYVDNYDPRLAKYPIFNFFEHDCFYWGRSESSYSTSLFLNQSESRIFLYNADSDSASDITAPVGDNTTAHWCNVAIGSPGYACTAGNVGNSGIDNYLNPRAFFEALHHHSVIGEAFLFASPVVDWKLVFFGDPLTTVVFPYSLPKWQDENYSELHNNDVIRLSKIMIENALQYGIRASDTIQEMVDLVIASADMTQVLEYLAAFTSWEERRNIEYFLNLYTTLIADWCRYVRSTTGLTVAEWLEEYNVTVSKTFKELTDKVNPPLDNSFVQPNGQWQFEFQYIHELFTLENVGFEISYSSDSNFTATTVIASTENGWYYEKEYTSFSEFPSTGFPSNLSKRRIRYVATASHYLIVSGIYYIRWRVIYANGSYGIWQYPDDTQFIITEGI